MLNIKRVNRITNERHSNQHCISAPLSKNAVSALPISCKLYSFTLKRFLKKLADNQCSSITKGSICYIKHNVQVHTTFSHRWMIRNLAFNGSIYYVLNLQILCFYLVPQIWQRVRIRQTKMWVIRCTLKRQACYRIRARYLHYMVRGNGYISWNSCQYHVFFNTKSHPWDICLLVVESSVNIGETETI